VLGDGDDVGAGNLGDGYTTVGLVGGIQVDVVRADTSGDGELELLGLGQALGSEVTGVEAACLLADRGSTLDQFGEVSLTEW
jgi:hypothetical protein